MNASFQFSVFSFQGGTRRRLGGLVLLNTEPLNTEVLARNDAL